MVPLQVEPHIVKTIASRLDPSRVIFPFLSSLIWVDLILWVEHLPFAGKWLRHFIYHFKDLDNSLTRQPKQKNPFLVDIKFKVGPITMSLWVFLSLVCSRWKTNQCATELHLGQGISLKTDSLVNRLYHSKFMFEIPHLSAKQLIPEEKVTDAILKPTWCRRNAGLK